MVVHQPGEWFADALQGLAGQDYPALQHLFLLTGDPNDPENQPARDLIETIVPGAVVRHIGGNPGYAASCNAVLDLVQGEDGLFCFVHDDVVLAPDAVSRLVEEMYRSNAGAVGPKLVHWDDPRMIQSVGIAVDRLGVEMPLADDGEIDQEQHDFVQDVFVLSSACLLVRADLFRSVGGFDAGVASAGTDLDFCWRVHLTGARVVIVPSAVARHRESMIERSDEDEIVLAAEKDSARLLTVMSLTARTKLPALVAEAFLVTLAHSIVLLVTGSPRRAIDELRALVSVPFSFASIRSRRARVVRIVSDAEVHALQVRGTAYLVGWLRRRDRKLGLEQAQAGASGARETAPRAARVMWSVLALLLVVGSRTLIVDGPADVGQFARLAHGPSGLFSSFASGWWNGGFGSVGSVPTGFLLTAAGGVATLGHMGLLRTAAVVLAPLVGWIGVWRFASVFSTRAARVAATTAYAAVPLAYSSIAAGRWGGLLTYALFPWLVHAMRRLVGHIPIMRGSDDESEQFGDLAEREWRRTFATSAILSGVLIAFEPGSIIAVAVLAATWSVVTLLHGARIQWAARWTGVGVAVVVTGIILNLPWSGSYVRRGWWESLTGAPVEHGRGLGIGRLLQFQIGDFVMSRPAVLLAVPVLGAMFVVRGSRLPWALRGSMLSIVGFLLVFLDDKALLPAHLPEPAVMLVPVAFGLAVCAGSMGAGLSVDLRGGRISWRQPLGFLVALAFALGLVPTAVNTVAGDWHQPDTTLMRLLTQLPDRAEDGDYRTLFIGDPRVVPGSPTNMGWGIAYSVINGHETSLADAWEPVTTRATDEAARAVRGIVRGSTARAGRLLAPLAVRFVVVPIIDGGLSTRAEPVPEPRGLVDALARQLDLKRRYSSPDLAIFENAAWVPVASVLTEAGAQASKSAGAESMIANDLSGATPVMPGVLSSRAMTVDVPAGTLHLSVPFSGRWRVESGGSTQVPSPAFGLTNAYSVQAGTATVRFDTPVIGRLLAYIVSIAWIVALWFAIPRRARVRRRRGSPQISHETAIVFPEAGR